MANRDFPSPVKGFSEGLVASSPLPLTSGYMNNVRAIDTLEKQVRIGQRPGQDKAYAQQIGGAAFPIMAICSVTVID